MIWEGKSELGFAFNLNFSQKSKSFFVKEFYLVLQYKTPSNGKQV